MKNTKYKQTDIGIIPEDWEVKRLGEISDVVGGGTPSTTIPDFWNGNINWFTPSEIGNSKYSLESERKITQHGLANSSAKILPIGTILLTSRASIGDISILKEKGCTNQGFQSLIANKNIDNEFLYYLALTLKNELLKNASGSTFLEVTPTKIRKIQIACPTLAEQTAIATALSDTDALITALDKKITKKKLVKQGAMQQLLTGKKRLQGFKGEWVENSIAEIGRVITGNTPSREISEFWNGNSPWISAQDISAKYIYSSIEKVTDAGKSRCRMLPINSVLVTCIASIGLNAIAKVECATNQQINSVICNSEFNAEFLYYQICHNTKELKNIAGQTAVPIINKGQFESFKLFFPPTKEEQTAIATILSDMDSEITALETKRDKYKQVKVAMMQELLTGKIRLIETIGNQVAETVKTIDLKPKKAAHNDQINEAVVISFLTDKFGTEKYPLSRFRYTKYAYLLHRQYEHEAKGFHKHAAGPYKPENRYKGAEGIALKNKYISKVKNPSSGADAFIIDENIDKALAYFQEWYGQEIQQWIEQFRYYKNDYLEVLATVDESICDLRKQSTKPTVNSVKEHIGSIPQWKAKLDKPYFNDLNIQKAINESYKLFGE